MKSEARYRIVEGFVPAEHDGQRIAALYGHLSSSAVDFTQLQRAALAPASTLVIAEESLSALLVGMGLVSIVDLTAKRVGVINDVVVHPEHRSNGIGGWLIDALIRIAAERDCAHIELTSAPQRSAARALYNSRGFSARDTTVFRLSLTLSNSERRTHSVPGAIRE